MMDYALEWNGYFIYKNPDGEDVMILTTNPDIKELRAAPAVWLRKISQSIEQSKMQVQGFAASVISLAINHYWHIRKYSKEDNPFPVPAKLEDLDCMLYCRKTEIFRTYMKVFAPIAREVWEQSPTLPMECSEGDNWYTYMYACECDARQAFLKSELYQHLTHEQKKIIYGYTTFFIEFLAKNYPVSMRVHHQIMEAFSRNMPPIQLHLENNTHITRRKEYCKKLSTFLIPEADPCADDDHIQTHLEEAAKGGATSLANYLSSDEGKKHFDFRNMSRSQVLAILNEECNTDIKDDTFYRACRACNLVFLNNAMK